MSIHPAYAKAIFRGEKRVEFRKRPIASDVTHVIVYATRPVCAVVGAFSVAGQETSNPKSLWSKFSDVAGIERARFDEYYSSNSEGTGIRIGEIFQACDNLKLEPAFGMKRPPQSFQYVDLICAKCLLSIFEPTKMAISTIT
jgi:predicted transcriptional regulator